MKLNKKQQEWLIANNKDYPVKCKMCDNDVKWKYLKSNDGKGGGMFATYCSRVCTNADREYIQNRTAATNMEKYGVKNPMGSLEMKNKKKYTMMERYGVEYALQSDEIKEKKKATCLITYGVEHPTQSEEIMDKIKDTNLERYGHENIAHGTKKEKIKQTNIERYGSEYAQQSDEIRGKIKSTNIEKYGGHPRQTEEVKAKGKATNLGRYGTEYPAQRHMVDSLPLLQSKEWLEDQYYTQRKTLTIMAEELGVTTKCIGDYCRNHDIEIRPNEIGSSYQERAWIESIMESEGIFIQYEGNGGQYKIPGTRFSVDGFCAETNTIYEFYGDYWHGNPLTQPPHKWNASTQCTMGELYQKTIDRESKLMELGYNIISIWENSYDDSN